MRAPTLDQAGHYLTAAWARDDDADAAYWQRHVDQLDPATGRRQASLPGAALWYARHGFHIFPLTPGHKRPLPRSRGLKEATTNPHQVIAWWRAIPEANIGIATGHTVDVVDIDGVPGNLSLARDAIPGLLDDVRANAAGHASTPRPGGRHYYLPTAGHHNGAALAPGIDYRGVGGYVVAPPSRIAPGGKDTPGTYRWITPPRTESPT